MADVEVKVGDRSYRLACDDGQENRVRSLAKEFDRRVAEVRDQNGDRLGDSKALVIAALALLDEVDEVKAHWSNMTPEGQAAEWAADRLDTVRKRLEKALGEA